VGGANGAGTVTWALDYMTPDGLLASLEETNADPRGVRPADDQQRHRAAPISAGASSVNAQAWNLSATPARGQRSMYRTSPAGFTLVVTGNATWPELRSARRPPSARHNPAARRLLPPAITPSNISHSNLNRITLNSGGRLKRRFTPFTVADPGYAVDFSAR